MQVTGLAENGLEVLKQLDKGTHTDILLADLNMPEMDGFELPETICRNYPTIKVIILTMHIRASFTQKAEHAGACAYIIKQVEPATLLSAIRRTCAGESFFTVIP